MCKGLSTLQGSGVRVRRVRVRVRTFWPSTNPWPLSRVRGFPGVSQGFYFSKIKVQIKFKQCWIGENFIQRGLTTFGTLSIVQNTLNPSYFINNLLKTMCTVIYKLEWCVFQSYLYIYLLSIKLEQLFGPNPCPNPAGVSYPPTPDIPLPLPFRTLDPWLGSRVLKGKGTGQDEDTPGLPLLIVMSMGKPRVILGWPWPLPFKTHHPAYRYRYLAGMGRGFEGVSGYNTCKG